MYVYPGLGRRQPLKMKTFWNLKTHEITKRWQMLAEKWGKGKFGAKELPHSYVEDHLVGRHLLRELAIAHQKLLLLLFLLSY